MGVVLVGAVLLLVSSCSGPSTSPIEDLRVTATVTPDTVRLMDAVTIRVVVTNQGTRARTIYPDGCMSSFEVADQSGTLVGPRGPVYCAAPDYPPQELAPGEEYIVSARPQTADLDAGTYTLRGRVRARGGFALRATGGYVKSAPVPLTVRPYAAGP